MFWAGLFCTSGVQLLELESATGSSLLSSQSFDHKLQNPHSKVATREAWIVGVRFRGALRHSAAKHSGGIVRKLSNRHRIVTVSRGRVITSNLS